MEKKVMLRIASVQRDENGKDETISLETPGILSEEDGVTCLSYEETELTGMEGTKTALFLRKDSVSLVRTGAYMQRQEYREGEETYSVYNTPLGPLDLVVQTKSIGNTVQGGNGQLRIVYDVELKNLFHHVNELVVDVWEDKGIHGSQRGIEGNH